MADFKNRILDLGEQLSAVPLNGAASTRTVTINTTMTGHDKVRDYDVLRIWGFFDHAVKTGHITCAVTLGLVSGSENYIATVDRVVNTSGNVTAYGSLATSTFEWPDDGSTGFAADGYWVADVKILGATSIKLVFAHDNTPDATDLLTVNCMLVG